MNQIVHTKVTGITSLEKKHPHNNENVSSSKISVFYVFAPAEGKNHFGNN